MFYQFLLINANSGKYPESKEQIESSTKKVKDFLKSDVVVKCDTKDRLNKKRKVENELYIIFEKDLKGIRNQEYKFKVSYPTNTVLYEFYYLCQGEHKKEIVEVINKRDWRFEYNIKAIMYNKDIRYENAKNAYSDYFNEQAGFSYVDIPLDAIPIEE